MDIKNTLTKDGKAYLEIGVQLDLSLFKMFQTLEEECGLVLKIVLATIVSGNRNSVTGQLLGIHRNLVGEKLEYVRDFIKKNTKEDDGPAARAFFALEKQLEAIESRETEEDNE